MVDASPEVLEINRDRVGRDVDYVIADVFGWLPERRFDIVFFSFWLSRAGSSSDQPNTPSSPGARSAKADTPSGERPHR